MDERTLQILQDYFESIDIHPHSLDLSRDEDRNKPFVATLTPLSKKIVIETSASAQCK